MHQFMNKVKVNSTIRKNKCPKCGTDLKFDREGKYCPNCGWRD